jgi:hypothetical protein
VGTGKILGGRSTCFGQKRDGWVAGIAALDKVRALCNCTMLYNTNIIAPLIHFQNSVISFVTIRDELLHRYPDGE